MIQTGTSKRSCKRRVQRTTVLFAGIMGVSVFLVELLVFLVAGYPISPALQTVKLLGYLVYGVLVVFFITASECKKHPDDRLLKEYFNGNPLQIYLLDFKGIIQFTNKSALSVFGYTDTTSLVGKVFCKLPLDIDEGHEVLRQQIEEVIAGKFAAYGIWRQDCAQSGEKILVAYTVSAIRDEYGKVEKILVEGRDITETRKLEENLAKTVKHQEVVLHSLPMSFYSYQNSKADRNLWVSDQLKNITGFPPEFFYEDSKRWYERLHPEDAEAIIAAKRSIVETGSYSLKYRWKTKTGEYRWFLDEAVYVDNGESGIPEIVGACIDITEEKERTLDLELMKTFLVGNANAIVCFGENQKCVFSNKAATDLFGYTQEEFAEVSHLELQTEKQEWEDRLKGFEGHSLYGEWTLVKKNGESFPAMVSVAEKQIGGVDYLYISCTDITSKKEMEKELMQAQKLEALGTLAGGLAHDYNNILSAIFGYTQLVRMNAGEPEKQEHAIKGIYNATTRAKELVQQILTFSKKSRNEKTVLQLSVLSKEVMKFIRQSIPSTIEIESQVNSESLVMMNPTEIHQMYVNLCTNCAQAMEAKGGVLSSKLYDVKAEEISDLDLPADSGDYVCIEISDTGEGMSQDTLNKICDPYFSTQQKAEGRGLGMAVVHGIISDHQGYLKIRSELEVGTTFRIYLPTIEREKDEGMPSIEMTNLRGHEHIMLVDDDPAIINVTTRVLQRNGYRVTSYVNGEEALEAYRESPESFDLVVSDLTMPKKTGAELAQGILEENGNFPFILCSGHQDKLSEDMMADIGIRKFLEKPYHMKELIAEIRHFLDGGT